MLPRFCTLFALILLIYGCSTTPPSPIAIEQSPVVVNYLSDVKPILDQRCVACHSCYNAACQAKFSSYEGIDRGATKIKVYNATRLSSIEPTRLFEDAKDTEEWRKKGFYSLTQHKNNTPHQSEDILSHLLNHKMKNPTVEGIYDPENESLICPKNTAELGDYFDEKPNHGMPYGFPALEEQEYNTLMQWVSQGAKGPTKEEQKKITTPSEAASTEIEKWELFFNKPDPKHTVTARYLYEHLYLAHLNFTTASDEFYTLVRSRTAAPAPLDEIVTNRPFKNPMVDRVYYRFKKVHSTIVHKTHMVVKLDNAKLARLNKQFIEPKWEETPHYIHYDEKESANPFIVFSQIPTRARYQFLLDNSHYIIMTFIRGPVCRGQMALNVIHDQFWVMFQDPDHDISIQQPHFLLRQANNLTTPIENIDFSVFKTFSDDYLKRYKAYYQAKNELYSDIYPEGLGYDAIWKGEKADDAPMLTIFRHFSSASVHKGALGGMPRTLWVIDYAQLERIYYTLVAGYDVFGNVSHQTNIRRYMDFLRMEGEVNFLQFIPKEQRLDMFKSWYIGSSIISDATEEKISIASPSGITYKTPHAKHEFVETLVNNHLLPTTNIKLDAINYFKATEQPPTMPDSITDTEDVVKAFKSLAQPGTGFLTHITDSGVNTILIRVTSRDGTEHIVTMVINRWHDNVFSMFSEDDTLDSRKDTIDFISGSVGSYINVLVELQSSELTDFLHLIKNFDGTEESKLKARKYFTSRSDPDFWKKYDWFQAHFNEAEPIHSGLYDLNRYLKNTWQGAINEAPAATN